MKKIQSKIKTSISLALLAIALCRPVYADGEMRVLTFPQDQTYGNIYVLQPGWDASGISVSITNERYPVRGTIKIDKSKKLSLIGTYALSEHMEVLKPLPPDSLTRLDLGRLPITSASLVNIKHLTGLKVVDLDQSDVDDSGLQHLKGLTNLECLSVSRTLVRGTSLSVLVPMTKLKRLHIGHCDLAPGALAVLVKLKALRFLHLGTTGINDATLDYVKPLTALRDLTIDGNKGITDKGLAKIKQFKQLTYLNLIDTNVTEAGLLGLKGLPLAVLKIQNTKVNILSRDKLKAAFPTCKIEMSGETSIPREVFAPLH